MIIKLDTRQKESPALRTFKYSSLTLALATLAFYAIGIIYYGVFNSLLPLILFDLYHIAFHFYSHSKKIWMLRSKRCTVDIVTAIMVVLMILNIAFLGYKFTSIYTLKSKIFAIIVLSLSTLDILIF